MSKFLKSLNLKKILVAVSLILNILGGTGVIPPVVGRVVDAGVKAAE